MDISKEQNYRDLAQIHKMVVRCGKESKYRTKLEKISHLLDDVLSDNDSEVQSKIHNQLMDIYYNLPEKAFVC